MRPLNRKILLLIPLAVVTATAVAGYKVQGWPGIIIWPIALCVSIVLFLVASFIIDVFVTFVRHNEKVNNLRAPLRRLSNQELQERAADPSRIDSGLARVELMTRDEDATPSKDQLFKMLTSGDSTQCGQAMMYVQVFYPELQRLLAGASNQDPRAVWKARVARMQAVVNSNEFQHDAMTQPSDGSSDA